jgi:hypothetical protein
MLELTRRDDELVSLIPVDVSRIIRQLESTMLGIADGLLTTLVGSPPSEGWTHRHQGSEVMFRIGDDEECLMILML